MKGPMVRLFTLAAIATAALACEWDYSIWIPRSQSADALYRFTKGDKSGYIDVSGHVVIPPILPFHGNGGSEFHGGLLEIAVGDGKYVDRTGKVVLDRNLYRGWDFSEGLAPAMKRGVNLWGYINTSGDFAIAPRFATFPNGYVYPFSEGLARIQVNGLFGYIDHSGAFVISPALLDGTDFADGMARVVIDGACFYFPEGACGVMNPVFPGMRSTDRSFTAGSCKFTYIDKAGRIITPHRFDGARDFSEGLAPVRAGDDWGFIDKTGTFVITPRFKDAEPFSSGLSKVTVDGKYGFVDKTGAIVIAARFRQAESFSEGLAVVATEKAFGISTGAESGHSPVNLGWRVHSSKDWLTWNYFDPAAAMPSARTSIRTGDLFLLIGAPRTADQ